MANPTQFTKYDEVLTSILVSEKSVLGFLSAIFNFLGRRTDFYYVQKSPDEAMGFPEGMAEELVIKVLRACNPIGWNKTTPKPEDMNNEIMCSTVAQEVEVACEETSDDEQEPDKIEASNEPSTSETKEVASRIPDNYVPPTIPTQKNNEAYNGAVLEKYSWGQTIMELDVTVKLPPDLKGAKDLKVVINSGDMTVQRKSGEILIKDTFQYKIKASETVWSISEGNLLIHLEKAKERWWTKLLNSEEEIDLKKIDCSRPIDELPDDHVTKIRELQWNQERKMQGLPTTDEMRNIEILRKAWDADGSPFKGQKFDPSILYKK